MSWYLIKLTFTLVIFVRPVDYLIYHSLNIVAHGAHDAQDAHQLAWILWGISLPSICSDCNHLWRLLCALSGGNLREARLEWRCGRCNLHGSRVLCTRAVYRRGWGWSGEWCRYWNHCGVRTRGREEKIYTSVTIPPKNGVLIYTWFGGNINKQEKIGYTVLV